MKKLSIVVLIIALSALAVFGGCKKQTDSHTYWQTTEKATPSGDKWEYFGIIYYKDVTSGNKMDEIWVNVSDAMRDEVVINLKFGSSPTETNLKYNEQNVTVNMAKAEKANGWVRICDELPASYKYMLVTVYDTMHFNEIVLLNAEHKVIEPELVQAGERSANHVVEEHYDLEAQTSAEEDKHLADKIVDEQKSFNFAAVESLFNNANK